MPTILEWRCANGQVLRCSNRCHNATHPECHCICGGRYHGANHTPGGLLKRVQEEGQDVITQLPATAVRIEIELARARSQQAPHNLSQLTLNDEDTP